jgi:hypothetical protein
MSSNKKMYIVLISIIVICAVVFMYYAFNPVSKEKVAVPVAQEELEKAAAVVNEHVPKVIPKPESEPEPEKESVQLLTDPEVIKLADCIIKLQPRTTPFVAKFMAIHIIKESGKKKLDPDLVAAQIWVESEFNPNATSSKAARGLMQVRYEVWKNAPQLQSNGVDAKHKIYWIDANIQSGTDILAAFIKEANGNLPVALNRYWTGNPKMDGSPWKNEYVSKILYFYFKIREHKLHGVPLEVEEIEAAQIPMDISISSSVKSLPAGVGLPLKAGGEKK